MVVVDIEEEHYLNHRDNVLLVGKYSGEEFDDSLFKLARFLEFLAQSKHGDVRKEIQKYGGMGAVDNFHNQLRDKKKKVESWSGKLVQSPHFK